MEIYTIESPHYEEFLEQLDGPDGCAFKAHEDGKYEFDCGARKRLALKILNGMSGIDVPASYQYFLTNCGFCRCQIMQNIYHNAAMQLEVIKSCDEVSRERNGKSIVEALPSINLKNGKIFLNNDFVYAMTHGPFTGEDIVLVKPLNLKKFKYKSAVKELVTKGSCINVLRDMRVVTVFDNDLIKDGYLRVFHVFMDDSNEAVVTVIRTGKFHISTTGQVNPQGELMHIINELLGHIKSNSELYLW